MTSIGGLAPHRTVLHTEVLIVGAGPTGLMLACELRRRGIDCLVIDQAREIDPWAKAVMVHAASLEQLESLGLRLQLEQRGLRQDRIRFYTDHGTSYTVGFDQLDTDYPYFLNVVQPEVERVLEGAYADLGGRLSRGWRYLTHQAEGSTVRVTALDAAGESVQICSSFLVGADGAASAVRDRLNVGFLGVTYPMSYLLAEGKPRVEPDPGESAMYVGAAGAVSLLPLGRGLMRVAGPASARLRDKDVALSGPEFQTQVDELGFGDRLRFDRMDRVSAYQVHERLADRFRIGQVFLAGDAAHLNSPAGGQAMNTGFADAAGLAWRLHDALRGVGDQLDDYSYERRYAAIQVARATSSLALLQQMREARTVAAREQVEQQLGGLAEAWSQLYVSYPGGAVPSALTLPQRHEFRLRVGARVPRLRPPLTGFSLLGSAHQPREVPPDLVGQVHVDQLPALPRQWLADAPGAALLVRPDRHVAAVIDAPT